MNTPPDQVVKINQTTFVVKEDGLCEILRSDQPHFTFPLADLMEFAKNLPSPAILAEAKS